MFISQPKLVKYSSYVNKNQSAKYIQQERENLTSTKVSETLTVSCLNNSTSPPKQIKTQINKTYTQIHQYIDNVDKKIQGLLDKQSNQFKVVYQHYFNKFKVELYQLKERTLKQEQEFGENTRMKFLESQLSFFTTETVNYQKACQKLKKENQELKQILAEKQQDASFYNKCGKNYLKQIKMLNSSHRKSQSQKKESIHDDLISNSNNIEIPQSQINLSNAQSNLINSSVHRIQQNHSPKNISFSYQINHPAIKQIKTMHEAKQLSKTIFRHKYSLSSTNQQKPRLYQNFNNKIVSPSSNANDLHLIRQPSNHLNNQSQKKSSHNKKKSFLNVNSTTHINYNQQRNKSYHTEIAQQKCKAQQNYQLFNICEWFVECINSVYKEICIKKVKLTKDQNYANKYRFLESLEEFKKADKYDVLIKFISNDNIIRKIYQQLKQGSKVTSKTTNNQYRSQHQNSNSVQKNNDFPSNIQSHTTYKQKFLQKQKKYLKTQYQQKQSQQSRSFYKLSQLQRPSSHSNTKYQMRSKFVESKNQKDQKKFQRTFVSMLYGGKKENDVKNRTKNVWTKMNNTQNDYESRMKRNSYTSHVSMQNDSMNGDSLLAKNPFTGQFNGQKNNDKIIICQNYEPSQQKIQLNQNSIQQTPNRKPSIKQIKKINLNNKLQVNYQLYKRKHQNSFKPNKD